MNNNDGVEEAFWRRGQVSEGKAQKWATPEDEKMEPPDDRAYNSDEMLIQKDRKDI